MQAIFALVDCNAFYVSCERCFNAAIQSRPVIVLSNNDGCAVAVSSEVKALGIKRGTPVFQIWDLIAQHHIVLFSSYYVWITLLMTCWSTPHRNRASNLSSQ